MGRLARSGIIRLDDTDRIVRDLNEENVQEIFERCLADTNTTEKLGVCLFSRALGYSEKEEDWVYFDKNKIKEENLSIRYLYGQLYAVHHLLQGGDNTLTPNSVTKKYTGELWSRNSEILAEFLYLGRIGSIVSPFAKESGRVFFVTSSDTLSPNDPNFPEWWKEHKPKWEERK
ncbi:MAG: hypothetical protein LUH09_05035 [Clostridiales bacterium]|nr:hypothetical protein [Clostridiales bacterium]